MLITYAFGFSLNDSLQLYFENIIKFGRLNVRLE